MVKKITTTIAANYLQERKIKITIDNEIEQAEALTILETIGVILNSEWEEGFITHSEKTLTGIEAVKNSLDQIEIKLPISDVDTGGER